jgi:hypothetical protein
VRRWFSLGRLAPEFRDSRRNQALAALALALVLTVLVAGTAVGFSRQRAAEGLSQVEFFSIEEFGAAPGGRIVYYPEMTTFVLRTWLMDPLNNNGTYQVWLYEYTRTGTGVRSIAMADAQAFVGLSIVGRADLSRVINVFITAEPPGGSTQPTGEPIVIMVERMGF